MIETDTVLVLGAGASVHAGLPIGNKLAGLIWNELNPGRNLRRILSLLKHDGNLVDQLGSLLHDSQIETPDFILASHPKLITIGKQAIAWIIGSRENPDLLMSGVGGQEHLYRNIWNHIHTTVPNELCKNKLKVVTFNYDRSFEEYMARQIAATYRIEKADAYKLLMNSVKVLHVHGQLGTLLPDDEKPTKEYSTEWMKKLSNPSKPELERFERVAAQIKIATQASVEDREFMVAQQWLSQAECVVFVGCAYHKMNMQNLLAQEKLGAPTRVFASTYNLGVGQITSGLAFLANTQNRKGEKIPLDKARNLMKIGNPDHKAAEFLRHSVAFDTSVLEAMVINAVLKG